ncbi:hypothetical protein [Sphingobacterium faecale]|uniref:Uncharacterized protein n=1 Tax=Sphingobacterium faecale TaxID=2803775 RepID=A0ABS1R969_9SPHI|nr:hypothetical protein [Sphingobacterium faecale]MBL1410784.1 hypothetical protein [Sphingobacterium faecale]
MINRTGQVINHKHQMIDLLVRSYKQIGHLMDQKPACILVEDELLLK